jgi:trehalose 6-phosphate phosphatase
VPQIRPWPAVPGTSGVFVDFDGTLAPIVDVPDQARALPGAASLLGRLATRFRRVAVISGRPVEFLAEHLAGGGAAELVGLYGLERMTADGRRQVAPEASRWRAAIRAAAEEAQAAAPSGLRIEEKGLAVTLHFRENPALEGWAEQFALRQAASTGLTAHRGKMSWELRPPTPTDKGTVIDELSSELTWVCFVGDDAGDLPAFAALRRLGATGVQTLAVAVAGSETPPELLAEADWVVAGPEGVMKLLEALADPGGRGDL